VAKRNAGAVHVYDAAAVACVNAIRVLARRVTAQRSVSAAAGVLLRAGARSDGGDGAR
jgi:hypothetical protein